MTQVSVVLPCLNEAASVGRCVATALSAMAHAGVSGEVVVVDNGSTDGSDLVASSAGARVVHEPRPGYGSALLAGIEAAHGEVVVMADADATYDLTRVPDLAAPVLAGTADMMVAARAATRRSMPALHRFVGTPSLTFLVGRAAGRRTVSDSQSGFRAFRRDAALALGLRGAGMEFASELLIRASRWGWRIREIPTAYGERIGESKLATFADGLRHLRLIALLAPDLVLVWPGLVALFAGLLVSLWSLVSPQGIVVGSIRWQPVFFSTIAMVIGAQALLAGYAVAYHSSLSAPTPRAAFIGTARFLRWCVRGGLSASLVGLAVDALLFAAWVNGGSASAREVQLASLAQGLIIVGVTVMTFGIVMRLVAAGRVQDPVAARERALHRVG
jgi:glycosyltransferase involved in cell wall biosynthesis